MVSVLLLVGCRLPKYVAPSVIDSGFETMNIKEIGVLPMADLRQSPDKPFKHADYLRKWLRNNIRLKGYGSEFTGNEIIDATIADREKVEAYSDQLANYLGDAKYRFVFLPILVGASKQSLIVGRTSEVSILGVIYDKESKKAIWMNEAGGEDTGFMAMSALSNVLAVDDAIGELMTGLPKARK